MLTSEPSDLAISSTWNALPSDLHKVIIYMAYHLHHLGLEKYNISSYRASVAVLSKIGPLLLSITPPITLFLIHDLLLCIFFIVCSPTKMWAQWMHILPPFYLFPYSQCWPLTKQLEVIYWINYQIKIVNISLHWLDKNCSSIAFQFSHLICTQWVVIPLRFSPFYLSFSEFKGP